MAYKDSKLKRAARQDIMNRELRKPKVVNPRALEKFREVPSQLRYKNMANGGKEDEVERD